MSIILSFPRSFIEKLTICLETTSNGAGSVSLIERVIKLALGNRQFLESIRLCPIIGLQVSLSESSAPFFMKSWMWAKESLLAVSSEELRSSLIKVSLIVHKTKKNKECELALDQNDSFGNK